MTSYVVVRSDPPAPTRPYMVDKFLMVHVSFALSPGGGGD